MRITAKVSKRVASPHPQVAELINTILATPNDRIADVLAPIDSWSWPRSDLHSWIKALNKLDEVYEQIIQEYDIEKLQTKDFSPAAKRTLLELLKFQRLLLENSTNRKLFNSYDRLSCLLFTSDVDILVASLQVILRPAQQYSAQPTVSQALRISTKRLQALAMSWPSAADQGIDMATLASEEDSDHQRVESLPSQSSDVHFNFYSKEKGTSDATAPTGPHSVHLPALALSAESSFEVLSRVATSHDMSPDDQFELLCRIRTSQSLGVGKAHDRRQLVIVRLLAIAIFAHTHVEQDAYSSLFLYEPDLVAHIAELLHLERRVPVPIRIAAVAALDALARYRGKAQDVMTSVNAGVNHGILMGLFRQTINDMNDSSQESPQILAEVVLGFISYLATHTSGGNMVIGAGLIPLLILITENKLPSRLSMVSKTMTLIDNILYGYPNSFQVFVASRGVDAMVNRVKYEVEYDLKEFLSPRDSPVASVALPNARSALLKHLLRSVHRMMHSSGTAEGLRGLIDSSLLKSVKSIIENRDLFGPVVLPLAINVMTTFVHNEPTSLSIIQEHGLPQVFYDTIVGGLEPSIEVIQAVPNAIGALCLNQTGLDQLQQRTTVIPRFFSIFTSEKHVKILKDKDNAAVIGGAIDELIRHQPTLSGTVFDAISSTLDAIHEMGKSFEPKEETSSLYWLTPRAGGEGVHSFNDGDDTSNMRISRPASPMDEDDPVIGPTPSLSKGNHVLNSLDVFNKFLEGLFQHAHHVTDFVAKSDGLRRLSDIISLPFIPFDFGSQAGWEGLVQVIRAIIELSPTPTMSVLVKDVRAALDSTRWLWEGNADSPVLFNLLSPKDPSAGDAANTKFRSLVNLHLRLALLTDVCQSTGYPHNRAFPTVLQALMPPESPAVLPDLGSLHRTTIWESITLKSRLSDSGVLPSNLPAPSAVHHGMMDTNPPFEASAASNLPVGTVTEAPNEAANTKSAKALTHVATSLPNTLSHFFQALVKMFLLNRRAPDPAHKKLVAEGAEGVAAALVSHFSFIEPASSINSYAYHTWIISLLDSLLFDERTSQNSLHTGLLLAFYRQDGIVALTRVCDSCHKSIARATSKPSDQRSDLENGELLRSLSCLKVALRVLKAILSAKPLFESGQTALLATPDKPPANSDYFEAHDLLCRVRLSALPTLCAIWRSEWLASVGGLVTKELVQTLLEVISASGEDAPTSSGVPNPAALGEARGHRHLEVDEAIVQQLCDMGFPRSAVVRALQRTNNNINAATEYLLAHPLPFPPDPAPAVATGASQAPATEQAPQDEPVAAAAANEALSAEDSDNVEKGPSVIPLEEVKKELDTLRNGLKEDFGAVALGLVDQQPDLVFEVKPAFIGGGWREASLRTVLDNIKGFSPSAHDMHEESLAVRFRLLALVLNSVDCTVTQQDSKDLMDQLLALLLAIPVESPGEQLPTPKWLASHLLVTHVLLIRGEEFRKIKLPADDEEPTKEPLFVGPDFKSARPIVFDICMRLLNGPSLAKDDLLATLRLLIHLTREQALVTQFLTKGGVSRLLQIIRDATESVSAIQIYSVMILRHMLEDTPTLEGIMKRELTHRFSQPRSRVLDVGSLMQQCSAFALRDPPTFLKVAEAECELVATHPTLQHVTLKQVPAADASTKDTGDGDAQMHDVVASEHPGSEAIIHLLLSEIVLAGRRAIAHVMDPNQKNELATAEDTSELKLNLEGQKCYQYACFLMQSLTELLFSYEGCKIAFLSYSKKKPGPKESKTKPFLHFLLSELIAWPSMSLAAPADSRRRGILSNWAVSAIIALCIDTRGNDSKDTQEIASARKFVLESISRVLRDGPPTNTEAYYARISAMSDLIHRLLTVKTPGANRERDDMSLQLAKLMLEKNLVAQLTTALSDIDVDYPGARAVVNSILKPLEQLTKVAIKMGRQSPKMAPGNDQVSDESEDDDDVQSGEEEDRSPAMEDEPTVDLYRNSALGMYGGDMDEPPYQMEDDEMANDDQDQEGDEMDYDEIADTDSQNTSRDSESSAVADEIEMQDNNPPEAWHDHGDELHDHDDGEDGEDDEDEDEDDDDDEQELGVTDEQGSDWNEIADAEGLDEEDPAEDEVAGMGDDLLIHDENDAEQLDGVVENVLEEFEALEGEEGAGPIHGNPFAHWLSIADPGGAGIIGRDVILRRPSSRRRPGEAPIFGHVRTGGSSAAESLGHPLMVNSHGDEPGPGLSDRHPARRTEPVRVYADLLANLEGAMGDGGAFQLLEHLLTGPIRGGEIVGVEVPGSGFITAVHRSGHFARQHRHVGHVLHQASSAPEFQPQPTTSRWAEEATIANGAFGDSRGSLLGSHLINSLIPAARVKAAAEKEEKERQEKEQQENESQPKESEPREERGGPQPSDLSEDIAIPPEDTTDQDLAQGAPHEDALPVVDSVMAEHPADSIVVEPPTIETTVHAIEGISVQDDPQPDIQMGEQDTVPPDVSQPSEDNDGDQAQEAGPSSGTERIRVMIHGNPVDITDTGIDPTFLEALPDDMREEVLNQHFREQRNAAAAARTSQVQDSHINSEFLDALPPDIRAELLDQEAEQRRRAAAAPQPEVAAANPATTGPVEMDSATFLATLDPQLRQVVLMEQDEAFLSTLPSAILAEAGAYREALRQRVSSSRRQPEAAGTSNSEIPASKAPVHKDAIHLLDKNGIATLTRLLFHPQLTKKHNLLKVLVNLCENTRARTELCNLLLSILQDAANTSSSEKIPFQLSRGTSQTSKPGSQGKGPLPETASNKSTETLNPQLAVQRCIDSLTYIASASELFSVFFLLEQDAPQTLRKGTTPRKGKGKEKFSPPSHYPIALLVGLLEKESVLKTTAIVDSLVALLAVVTKPLQTLKAVQEPAKAPSKEAEAAEQTAGEGPGATAGEAPAPVVSTSTEQPAQASAPEQVQPLLAKPPQIQDSTLRLLVNILAAGECSNKTFHNALALIQHVSYLPGARDVIAKELGQRAQALGDNIAMNLEQLLQALNSSDSNSGDILPAHISSKFSSPSADQAKLLRVLKTIEHMFDPARQSVTRPQSSTDDVAVTDGEKIKAIHEAFAFDLMWSRLSSCLSAAEERGDMENLASMLLPLMEALMVVCKYLLTKSSPSTANLASPTASQPPLPLGRAGELFVTFTDQHRKVLNLMVRNNPSLMSGSFSLLVENSRVLDFDNKRNYFTQQLRRKPIPRENQSTLQLNVRRARVFEDSFQVLQRKSGEQIKYGKLSVRFYDEEGVDAGGLTREWFTILARQMFNPDYALFQPCAADKLTYQPNRASSVNPEHLSFFKFVGRIIGKAIFDGRLLDAYFARSLYRQLLGKPVDYKDVEWVDPEYYKSLIWILENDPTPLDLTFIVEDSEFGLTNIVPLKENGGSIAVTQENKREYVQLSAEYRLVKSIKQQIDALLGGFYEIIPKDLISIFNEQEVELLISGTPEVDVDEWRAATDYHGYTSSDPVIVWWWRALKSFNREERAKVLSFATGTARVPLGGFADLQGVQGVQRFSIHKAYGNADRLPQAHTCFNQIDLPEYSSYEKLRTQLLLAINEGSTGFGFA